VTQKDRDNYFAVMVMWSTINKWLEDSTSELTEKDKHKLTTINKMIIELLVQYKKRDGDLAYKSIIAGIENYHFAILKDDTEDLTNTFEPEILKNAIKSVVDKNKLECLACEKTDFKNCEWFTLKNIVYGNKENCKSCPYRNNLF